MEIRFLLSADDVQVLIDETIATHIQRDERLLQTLLQWQERYLVISSALLSAVLAPWLLYGHYTLESIIALILVIPLMLIVYRRLAPSLRVRWQKRQQTDRPLAHALLQRSLRRFMANTPDRFIGLHTWHIGPDTLRIELPNGQQVTTSWRHIVRVSHTPSFYRLTRRWQPGLAYVLPKHSQEMEGSAYQQGIAMLLERCMPHADQDRKTPRR